MDEMIKDILLQHKGYIIAINATNPERLESCGVKEVGEQLFSIITQNDLLIHIPYSRILSIVENSEGGAVKIKSGFSNSTARVVVHIEHMIIYKGSTGFGFQVPA